MKKSDLTVGSISSHIKRIAIPTSIGFLFNTFFNVVDTIFAGQISTDALSGLTLSFPIFFIIIAIASGFGNGLTALISIALGKKEIHNFHKLILNALLISGVFGLLFIFVLPNIISPLFEFAGASGVALQYGLDYTQTIFIGAIFFLLNFVFNAILSSQGNTKPFRNYLVIGFFLNLILDPLFILGWFGLPELGTQGVALATILVQAFGSFYMGYNVLKSELFNIKKMTFKDASSKVMKDIFVQGIPSSLNLAAIAIGVFIINYYVLLYGGDVSVASYGAALRIQQVALLPSLGLNVAIITMIGQNLGANQFDRMNETKKTALKMGLFLVITGGLAVFIFAPQLMSIFNSDPDVISIGSRYLRIDTIGFVTYLIINVNTSVLQGIKKPAFALLIGIIRQLLPLIVFPLLSTTFQLGLDGVWIGIVVINWLATFILIFVANYIFKNIKKTMQ
ncbi:MAG: MATE family efflux transporter [Acholeplasmataceae bacterium]